jgi:hypothetical protein
MRSARSLSLALSSALLLAACAHLGGAPVASKDHRVDLPPVPADLKTCFVGVTTLPPEAQWDAVTTTKVIIDLRKSEAEKTDCGRRLIRFYEDLRAGMAK